MANRFKDPALVRAYESLMASYIAKDAILFLPSGERAASNKAAELFWSGFNGVEKEGGWDPDSKRSIGYAYWRAGQDACALTKARN
jgi:hypothetical protein